MKQAPAKSCASCGERYDADVLFCPRDGTPLASSRRSPAFSSAERDPYLGLELAGQIQVRHLIGIGSMGRVYRAFQAGIERDVAVKVLHRELSGNAELVSRFHREAKVASRLVHPNVVQVLMTGTVPSGSDPRIGGEMYLVMEHLDGMSLLSALAAAGTGGESEAIPLPRALHIALQICDAVGEAHAQGIVHRDLKPENVMLVRRSEDQDYVKVLDFGIARLDWADKSMATQAGLIFGTAKYISPEGAEGHPVGPPADVYSIATILYQCLAGRAPFEGDSPVALLVQHTHAPPAELRSIARASYVPAPIAQVVMQNLSKKPSERAQDARALGRDLALAVRASGLDPDDLAAQTGLLRTSAVVKLASKSRTKSLELSPDLAAKIGGVAAPTLESARPPDLGELLPAAEAEPRAPTSSQRHGLERQQGDASPGERASSSAAMLGWSGPHPAALTQARSSRGSSPSSPTLAAAPDDVELPAARGSQRHADEGAGRGNAAPLAALADLDFGGDPAHDSAPAPSTMQGLESEAEPRPRRARVARIVAILACAAAASLIVVVGGRQLVGFGVFSSSDSLDGLLGRARDGMDRHAWDAPPGENVKELTAQALTRWPSDPRPAEVRREASERIIADALGHKYSGDRAGAIRLARLALELQPAFTTAQHLVAELEASATTPAGEAPAPQVAPVGAPGSGAEVDRRLPVRRGGADARPPAVGASGKAGAAPLPPTGVAPSPGGAALPPVDAALPATGAAPAPPPIAPAPALPPTPPPLPNEPAAPLPPSTGPWL
jgi:eukaryotic-like serine/threonine-protein kinase